MSYKDIASIDIPVAIFIWKRPELQKMQFEIIKDVKPNVIFLFSDGPRNNNEKKLIGISRDIFEQIDWSCTVYKIFEENNIGMYNMLVKASEFVFHRVDRCIFLEDDCMPSKSYFRFTSELLEKYKDDERILMICGMNHFGINEECTSDYFFSDAGSIWGIAFWKRTYQNFYNEKFIEDSYARKLLLENSNSHFRNFFGRVFQKKISGDYLKGFEYNLAKIQAIQNQLIIVPKKNMICNRGHGSDSTHSTELKLMPKRIRKIFNMNTHEISFPMVHPNYVIPDFKYGKKVRKLMGFGYPLHKLSAKLEGFVYKIINQ